jgi:hypothetical protein
MLASPGSGSRRRLIGTRSCTVSPDFHSRWIVTYEPGFAAIFSGLPFTATVMPDCAHDG